MEFRKAVSKTGEPLGKETPTVSFEVVTHWECAGSPVRRDCWGALVAKTKILLLKRKHSGLSFGGILETVGSYPLSVCWES